MWHQPNLEEDDWVVTCRGRGSSHNCSSAAFIAHDNPVYLLYLHSVWEVACCSGSNNITLAYHFNMIKDVKIRSCVCNCSFTGSAAVPSDEA